MRKTLLLLSFILFLLTLFSLSTGRYPVELRTAARIMASTIITVRKDWKPQDETVVLSIRLPRITGAILTGAGLSFSAAVLQTIFRNPLVSPFTLGVSSGAGFGACIAILMGFNNFFLQLSVFTGGILAVFLTCLIGLSGRGDSRVSLVLAGVIVSGFFTSLISILKYLADPYEKLPEIVYWMMGSLARTSGESILWALPVIFVSFAVLYFYRWKFDILSLGDLEATALGENATLLKITGIIFTTLLVSSTVALAGVIGWVGLVIANMTRLIAGPSLKNSLPVSALLGAIYLLAMDDLARTLSSVEIPLGILTSLAGTPVFVYILVKLGRK